MSQSNFGITNYKVLKLDKWTWDAGKQEFKVEYIAPKGGVSHWVSEKIDIEGLVPHGDLWVALHKLKPLVCMGMDWAYSGDIESMLNVFELVFDRHNTAKYDVYISFEYRGINTGVTAKYKKGVMFTSYEDMGHSLDEDQLDLIATFVEELRAFVGREKGSNHDLFSLDGDGNEKVEVSIQKN